MPRRAACSHLFFFTTLFVVCTCAAPCWGQDDEIVKVNVQTGLGAYFAWYKLLLFAMTYLFWVRVADRINRDLLRNGEPLQMPPQLWNLINIGSFLLGLICALAIPIFWIGWPLMVVGCFLPPILYSSIRKAKLKASDSVRFQVDPKNAQTAEPLPQDLGVDIDFTAAGATKEDQTRALIMARNSPAFEVVKNLVANMLIKRADSVILDYTQTKVDGRIQVDGAWHALPPLERADGDNALTSFKYLAGLNPLDRRNRQVGNFRCKFHAMDLKTGIEVLSQGVSTGERVQIRVLRATGKDQTLAELGMWSDMSDRLVECLNGPGLSIISGPNRGGLTTTWRSALTAMDRYTRDCIVVIDPTERESEIENLQIKQFPEHGNPMEVLKPALLTQPDVVVIPNPMNSETMDRLTYEAVEHNRTVVTKIHSPTAAEALLRVFSLAKDKKQFAKAIKAVTCQRLIRRLCETCRQPVPVKPDFVQKLGGDPRQVQVIYTHFVPPPQGTLDEKGNPIEIPPCPQCQGIGYVGRSAIFELIVVDDNLRKVLLTQPQLPAIIEAAKKGGNRDQMQESYRSVLAGITSIDEIRRVFQPPK